MYNDQCILLEMNNLKLKRKETMKDKCNYVLFSFLFAVQGDVT